MDRADDRSCRAATWVPPAPHVTLNWQAKPFTLRGGREEKWIREKSGRKVLQTPLGNNRHKYWRAPRPRPKLNRRRKRQKKKQVLEAKDHAPPANLTDAHVTIQVLQAALRAALLREELLKDKLQKTVNTTNKLIPPEVGDDALLQNDSAESGFAGVTRNKAGWAAHTKRQQSERTHLGTFDTPVEAARARRDYYADIVAAAVQQAPRWIPNPTFCIFWSIVLFVIVNVGIPWFLVPIGLILIYRLLMCAVDV